MDNTFIKTVGGWSLEVVDSQNFLNAGIIEELKGLNASIYHNDLNGEYWIYDFKHSGVWFEALKIDMVKNYIKLNAYN